MSTICNYSHPELQITEGLKRHGHGLLFPYNPEFYDLTSGLYGPGAIICWQLLLLSVMLSWSCCEKDEDGQKTPGVTVDLLGALAYPIFSATDALISAMKMLKTKERALAVFCFRYPVVHIDSFTVFNRTQLDLREPIPTDILYLGQRALNLMGPLDICYVFLGVYHVRTFCWFFYDYGLPMQGTKWAERLALAAYIYVVLVLWIIHCSLGDFGISMFLWLYETISPFLQVFCWFALGATLLSFIGMGGAIVKAIASNSKQEWSEAAKMVGSLLILVAFVLGPTILAFFVNDMHWLPDTGISISERDQLATLIVGIATLLYTIYEIGRRWIKPERSEGDVAEMQPLDQDAQ